MAEEKQKISKLKVFIDAGTLTAVVLISYFIGYGISILLHLPNNYVSGMWCAATAIVVFDDLPDNSKNLLKDRILGTLMGTVVSAICMSLMGQLILSVTISLLIVSICISLLKWEGTIKIACITVLIVGVTTHGYSDRDIIFFSSVRFLECLVGGTISFIATLIISHINKANSKIQK